MSPDNPSQQSCQGPFAARAIGWSRRRFLETAGHGFGALALSQLLGESVRGAGNAAIRSTPGPHFAPKAKRCIFLFMVGGPSQMDLFDPKPELNRLHGKRLPDSFGKVTSQFLENDPICLGSTRTWGRYGQSGMDISDLIPAMHPHADRIALVRSCAVDSVVHAPAHYQMNSGRIFMGYPSLGSWVTYGLGNESDNLPSFVVMAQPQGTPEAAHLVGALDFYQPFTRAPFFGPAPSQSSIWPPSTPTLTCHVNAG